MMVAVVLGLLLKWQPLVVAPKGARTSDIAEGRGRTTSSMVGAIRKGRERL